jgi:predicted metal-dependent phosphoesterase TrpH
MPRFDHHLHTVVHSPDSLIGPFELIDAARRAGLDGVVITDHDELWEPDELAELQAVAPDLVILAGAEVSTREGHFLVYGLDTLDDVPPGVRLAELLDVAEARGAAVVAAHPYRWNQPFDELAARHARRLCGLELVSNNVSPETRRLTEAALARHGLRATGSSDAHEAGVVGCYATEFEAEIRTMADFVAALRSGRFRPVHRPGGIRLAAGPVATLGPDARPGA